MFARLACNLLRRTTVRRFLDYRVVVVDYPVDPTSRWQAGNPHVATLLDRQSETFRTTIAGMNTVLPIAETITSEFWGNEWFPPVDAIALMWFIARNKREPILKSAQVTQLLPHGMP